jgi:CHAT domain-containing protein
MLHSLGRSLPVERQNLQLPRPFHALFDGSDYLIDRFAISYAPAATMYELFVARQRPLKGQALLIGTPDERAPLIAEEIESIRAVLDNARTFVGKSPTRECLRQEMKSAGIIPFCSKIRFRRFLQCAQENGSFKPQPYI